MFSLNLGTEYRPLDIQMINETHYVLVFTNAGNSVMNKTRTIVLNDSDVVSDYVLQN